MNCPMCGELWDRDKCGTCGWREPPDAVQQFADLVLKYSPKARSKPAVQRKRRRTILLNKQTKKGKRHG